jgi:hypothetical protein
MCNLAKALILKLEISIPRIVETSNLFLESFFHLLLSTGAGRHWSGGGERGGNTEGAPKKDFGTIPYFLVIADYKKAFQYVVLK